MIKLDRTEQRIVGVLIEKQRTVPDTYPMSENALVTGCNQSSNRDPEMSLQSFEVAGALMALHGRDVVVRIEGGGRVVKYRHKLQELLGISDHQVAVLCELLLRGPQAPGALKPRVARLGFHGTPQQIEEVLRELAAGAPPLVAQEPRRPRERDNRWRHLLGDGSEIGSYRIEDDEPGHAFAAGAAGSSSLAARGPAGDEVLRRLAALEQRVAHLEQALGEVPSTEGSSTAVPSTVAPSTDVPPKRPRLGD